MPAIYGTINKYNAFLSRSFWNGKFERFASYGTLAMEEKLRQIFASSLGIKIDDIQDDLRYSTIPQWDSVAHMALVAAIEEEFDIMIDAESVIDMSSFAKAKEIVTKLL